MLSFNLPVQWVDAREYVALDNKKNQWSRDQPLNVLLFRVQQNYDERGDKYYNDEDQSNNVANSERVHLLVIPLQNIAKVEIIGLLFTSQSSTTYSLNACDKSSGNVNK